MVEMGRKAVVAVCSLARVVVVSVCQAVVSPMFLA